MALALTPLCPGGLTARLADGPDDREAALGLRRLCFRSLRGIDPAGEGDDFDVLSDHLLIEDADGLQATCRLRLLTAADLGQCYSGQFYDLSRLAPLPALEIGRFCAAPEADPDALRLAFAALTRLVDAHGVGLMFGCTSFEGTSMAPYRAALAPFAHRLRTDLPATAAETTPVARPAAEPELPLPVLMRRYLGFGAFLSDQAVIDRDLGTCHVLTILPVTAIPRFLADAMRAWAAMT